MASGDPTPDTPGMSPRRKVAIGAGVAFVVLVVVVGVLSLLGYGGPWSDGASEPGVTQTDTPVAAPSSELSPSASASASDLAPEPGPSVSTSARPKPPAVPKPSIPAPTATGKPTIVPTKTTPTKSVPLASKAALSNGVSVRVTKIESVTGVAQGPGEIAGPAVRVTVEVTNGTNKKVPMNMALVNLYYGKDKTPASTLSGPGLDPLAEPIPPGKSASGRYVFSVPKDGRDPLTVEFSYTTAAPTVIFTGKP